MFEEPRRIVFLLYAGCLGLDVMGPMDVFHVANMEWAAQTDADSVLYSIETVALCTETLLFSSGLCVTPDRSLDTCQIDGVNTLFVPGGWWHESGVSEEIDALCAWLRTKTQPIQRLVSVCTGSFFFARCGLLDGRRATTHWLSCEKMQQEYPAIQVEPDALYVKSDHIYTSAGVSAGIDLALALLEEDMGSSFAMKVARYLVLFLHRRGGQSQFSAFLRPTAKSAPIRRVQRWIAEQLDQDLRVEALAKVAAMSPRHFARCFKQEVGLSPARFVEKVRVEAARTMLERYQWTHERVACLCGFSSAEVMRRVFLRQLHISPREYRDRWGKPTKQPAQ